MMLSEEYTKAEFFDRLDRDLSRRAELENKLSVSVDNRCTFTPGINQRSKNLKARSSYELSKGDFQRRENKKTQIRLKTEQEALQGMTFQPEITKRAQSAGKSRLQLRSDSSLFLEKYKLDQEKAAENRIKKMNEKRLHELDGCTFTPLTKECPSYVKRIAKSMAIVRAARASANPVKNTRPQWK